MKRQILKLLSECLRVFSLCGVSAATLEPRTIPLMSTLRQRRAKRLR